MLRWIAFVLLASALVLPGCGSDESKDEGVGALDGTWSGNGYWADSGSQTAVQVVIASGGFTDIRMGGSSLGVTGSIVDEGGGVFSYTLSDGTIGGFLVAPDGVHAAFIDQYGTVGAVQKDAGAGSYAVGDIVGSWSGGGVTTNWYAHDVFSVSVTVDAGRNFSGSVVSGAGTDPFSGFFDLFSATYGAWEGIGGYTGPAGYYTTTGTGNIDVYMTPDKQFIGGEACVPDYSVFPGGCSFFILTR